MSALSTVKWRLRSDKICQETNTYWMLGQMELFAYFTYSISIFFPTPATSEAREACQIWSHLSSWVGFDSYTRSMNPCVFPKHYMRSHPCLANLLSSLSSCFLLSHSSPSGHPRELTREDPFPQWLRWEPKHLTLHPLSGCIIINAAWGRGSGLGSYVHILGTQLWLNLQFHV